MQRERGEEQAHEHGLLDKKPRDNGRAGLHGCVAGAADCGLNGGMAGWFSNGRVAIST